MENLSCTKMQASVKKVKKKPVKDEMDRVKQAEKKKRRLEKALATSAAIRLELEKKKLKKKEEQQRLDDEGAAIAEAVALNVLLEEGSEDDLCQLTLKNNKGYYHWDCPNSNVVLFAGRRDFNFPPKTISKCSFEEESWVPSNAYGSQWEIAVNMRWAVPSFISSTYTACSDDDVCWVNENAAVDANVLAAQTLSSLRIADGSSNQDNVMFNGVFRG